MIKIDICYTNCDDVTSYNTQQVGLADNNFGCTVVIEHFNCVPVGTITAMPVHCVFSKTLFYKFWDDKQSVYLYRIVLLIFIIIL